MEDGIKQHGTEEKEQIKKYGGFYIGRYEAGTAVLDNTTGIFKDSVTFNGKSLNENIALTTSAHGWTNQNTDYLARNSSMKTLLGSSSGENKANGNIVVRGDAIPYHFADYYTALEMSERLYTNKSSVYSGLVTGTQWDMMMKYLENNGVSIKGENCIWGNYYDTEIENLTGYYIKTKYGDTSIEKFKNGSELENNKKEKNISMVLTTGASEKVKKMNLYDVAGNLWEWTNEAGYWYNESNTSDMESSDYNSFICRGGALGANHDTQSACARSCNYSLYSYCNFGFRVVLYIK